MTTRVRRVLEARWRRHRPHTKYRSRSGSPPNVANTGVLVFAMRKRPLVDSPDTNQAHVVRRWLAIQVLADRLTDFLAGQRRR